MSGPRLAWAGAAAAASAAVLALSAQAATRAHPRTTAIARAGVPAVVHPGADLAAQDPGHVVTWVDSIFIAGYVRGAGHTFGILVHTLRFPNANQRKLYISINDTTTGWYRRYQALIPRNRYSWRRKGLHITMPGLSWTGSARTMRVRATTPWGSLDLRLAPRGPVLNYSAVGLAGLLGDVDHEYAFPTMRTVGTLSAEHRRRRVSGVSWLDRQWGPLPLTEPTMRWTWMDIGLSNHDQLAVWDIVDKHAQNAWVTVLRPDGSYEVAAIRPLARGARSFWTSAATGKAYPTRWRVEIPALRARLTVADTGHRGQEFPDGHVEATAAVTGSYKARKVTGTTFVEMTGDWSAPRRSRPH